MAILAGRVISAADVTMPAVVTNFGNGTNTVTSTSEMPCTMRFRRICSRLRRFMSSSSALF